MEVGLRNPDRLNFIHFIWNILPLRTACLQPFISSFWTQKFGEIWQSGLGYSGSCWLGLFANKFVKCLHDCFSPLASTYRLPSEQCKMQLRLLHLFLRLPPTNVKLSLNKNISRWRKGGPRHLFRLLSTLSLSWTYDRPLDWWSYVRIVLTLLTQSCVALHYHLMMMLNINI